MGHAARPSSPGTLRILLVEDEAIIRLTVGEALREAGHVVVEAPDARRALECLAAGEPFDAVFTDVRMPGAIDGIALAQRVKDVSPTTAVLITTGNPNDVPREWRSRTIAKPYDISAIARQIRQAMDAQS